MCLPIPIPLYPINNFRFYFSRSFHYKSRNSRLLNILHSFLMISTIRNVVINLTKRIFFTWYMCKWNMELLDFCLQPSGVDVIQDWLLYSTPLCNVYACLRNRFELRTFDYEKGSSLYLLSSLLIYTHSIDSIFYITTVVNQFNQCITIFTRLYKCL